jgi:hypothetical protein
MMEHAAIQGTFADLKSVKTRSVVQMVVEIPIEQAERIVSMFGFPQPGAEIAVAVARLDPEKASPSPPEAPAKPKKRFSEYSLAEQAGMRCQDAAFQSWLYVRYREQCDGAGLTMESASEIAASVVRWYCGVDSRRDLDNFTAAGGVWEGFNAEFEQWAGLVPEAR